jgi:hypothetical protein
MKKSQRCIKCDGRKIWIIEPFRVPDAEQGQHGRVLPLVPHQSAEARSMFRIPTLSPKGELDLLVCASCGYAEFWARGLDALKEDPSAGIRLLDAGAKPEGPFR